MIQPPAIGYACDYTVQTYDIESHKRMTAVALLKLMQEAAMQNVMQLKVCVWDLEPHHISWVLLRMSLKISRLPSVGETIRVVTSPAGFEKFFTYRDYCVYGKNDELLASASSAWLLIDTLERRMTRIPDFILAFTEQMPLAETLLPRPKSKLPHFEAADSALPFRVNWHDLDFNDHLNNAYYIQWMLEPLPDQTLHDGTLREFDIQFKVEAQWKEEVRSEVQAIGSQHFLHRLVRVEDGKELALAESKWR